MSDIDRFLSMLDKPKRNGEGKWLACCSAHEDKSPSLAIKLTDDGKILIHCFAGCDVESIVSALGLSLSDLMPDNLTYKKGSTPTKFNKYELFDKILYEARILSIAIRQVLAGKELDGDDRRRVIQAENTIDDLAREVTR